MFAVKRKGKKGVLGIRTPDLSVILHCTEHLLPPTSEEGTWVLNVQEGVVFGVEQGKCASGGRHTGDVSTAHCTGRDMQESDRCTCLPLNIVQPIRELRSMKL